MLNGPGTENKPNGHGRTPAASAAELTVVHPAWQQFIRFCAELQHGDIERLRIQDGLPVLVELAIRKVKLL